ncbi:hypothetical protein RND59_09100 [Vibrio ruber]|uniref:hypothetical protein n=1 Tax=Vibrio ruber TaxID=184755 RepID=UPI002892FDC3|nr:hypothetical protein [Vibrio ruber]WNJ94325.1 hypothetical protein RND59_09100 [Vibrio ruber]
MKLSLVLNHTNQVERSKFVNCIDRLCQSHKDDTKLLKQLEKIDGQLKAASGNEITQLFNLIKEYYKQYIKEQIAIGGPQVSLLVNILSRDGNCIASIPWIEKLYAKEYEQIDSLSQQLISEMKENEEYDYNRIHRIEIYKKCVSTAFNNDEKYNRETKITDDERSILNVLAERLGLSREEVNAIDHTINPIPHLGIENALEYLREHGIILVNRRRSEVMVAEEVVDILHEIQGKDLNDKYVLRILRSLTDSELSNILKSHGQKIRGVERQDKIATIAHSGISIRSILENDIHSSDTTQNQKKDRIKNLIDELSLDVQRIGAKLQERVDVLITELKESEEREFNSLSVSGYKELLEVLTTETSNVEERLRKDFEIENKETLDPERLKALNITPTDILYLYTNDEIKQIRNDMGLPKRGNPRTQIIESFASANDRYIENYHHLASRDLHSLCAAGIDIKEAELGVKFEEVTRSILEQLGLNVDEDLRKDINTTKDKADIIISLENDDVIVGEAKSFKNGQYAKYSSTSRQVKSYVKRCEENNHRVAQVLIIAPSFSEDFIDAADMDTEINISLLEAEGLQKIYTAFKQRKKPNFTAKLLTKGGLLKADLISKSI